MPDCIPGSNCYSLKARICFALGDKFNEYANLLEKQAELNDKEEIQAQKALIDKIQEQISEKFFELQNIPDLQGNISDRLENTSRVIKITEAQFYSSAINTRSLFERTGEPDTTIPKSDQKKLRSAIKKLLSELL